MTPLEYYMAAPLSAQLLGLAVGLAIGEAGCFISGVVWPRVKERLRKIGGRNAGR